MNLRDSFLTRYGTEPAVFWAPGRVNLIGEHIDYCGGSVLPMPIQFGTHVAITMARDRRIAAVSCNVSEAVEFATDVQPTFRAGHWGRYVAGAITCMDPWIDGRGLDILVSGDIPGSGLSSSASLSVALLAAIAATLDVQMDALQLARLAQRIEHEFVGVGCGLMDQAVIAMGTPNAALLFDCQTEAGRSVHIPATAPEILVVDSGKRRALVYSAYGDRLDETGRAARSLGVPREQLAHAEVDASAIRTLDAVARRRYRHVVSEQRRVQAAVVAMETGDWLELGRLFRDSHVSLVNDFEVSCAELDALVDLLNARPECLGARMTGAGFGGSVVALIERGKSKLVADSIEHEYPAAHGLPAKSFVARSIGGVRQVHG